MKFKILWISLIVIVFSLPSICFSEMKTVTGEDCSIVTGDKENTNWDSEREYLRYKSVFNGLNKITKKEFETKQDQFDFFRDIQKNYLENFKVISHTENGRKICEKVQFTIDTEVLQEVKKLHNSKDSSNIPSILPDSKVWEYFGTTSSGDWYYNKTNLTKSSNIVKVWIYMTVTDDYRKNLIETYKDTKTIYDGLYKNYDHDIQLWEMDCKNRRFKMGEYLLYDDKGNVLLDGGGSDNEKQNTIVPDSINEILYQKVCVLQKKPLKKK